MKSKQSYILNRSITTMLIAVMLLFIAAVFGHMKAYADEGDVKAEGLKPVSWKIVEIANGEQELQIGNANASIIEELYIADFESSNADYAPDRPDTTRQEESQNYEQAAARWPWHQFREEIDSVDVVGKIVAKGDLYMMFAGFTNVKSITNLQNINTEQATRISRLFTQPVFRNNQWELLTCPNLTKLEGITAWDTSNAQEMAGMFMGLSALSGELDLSGYSTPKVNTFEAMFDGCEKLTKITFGESFDTSKVKSFAYMFTGCRELTSIVGIENFKTDAGQGFRAMFSNCRKITELNLSGWKTDNATHMNHMFFANFELKKIAGLDKWDTSNVETMESMFRGCYTLETADMIYFDTSSVTNADRMFQDTTLGGSNKISEAIAAMIASGDYDPATVSKLEAASDAIKGASSGQIEQPAKDTLKAVTAAGDYVTAEEDKEAAEQAVSIADQAEKEAEKAKEDLEKAKAEEPQDPDKIKAAQEKYGEKAKAAEDAVKAADEAVAKAAASAEKTNDATMKNNAQAVADKLAPIKAAYDARKANDAADAAIDTAKSALKEAKDAKTAADGVAASSPGSDAAVKAAEEATAKAEAAAKAADDAVKAAEATGDQSKIDAAKALKADADKALADATKLEAEQKIKRAENNPSEENKKAAQDAANKALEVAKKTYGENSAEAQAAQQLVNNANALPTTASKIGQEITVSKNVYVITKDPGATWDGEVTLKTAKNAKNVSVPKVVKHEGNSYEVNRVKAGAFRAKKIRKVTLGANIEKLDKNAFKKSKATTIVVKTKSLTKARVKGALKGSKVKTVQVKVGSKKVNKKFVKKYKKIFTKKNAGKKVTVK